MVALSKLVEAAAHPSEVVPLVKMALAAKRARALPQGEALAFCYDMLNRVSRSFAIVIQQLPPTLRTPVCVFYLVLRALDTVEDDMAVPVAVKVPLLRSFADRAGDADFTVACGYGPYVDLMRQYRHVAEVFNRLDPGYAAVITDITRRMGAGMADFIEKEVVTVADYDLYCHYVAGLVGVGLSELFAASGLESTALSADESLNNHMGLFLQKTNIIRDYLEDILEEPAPRMFWPRDIWGRYASSLAEFKDPAAAPAALRCLNHMVTDALRHALPALTYMSRVADPSIFRFCAIPQVMAARTLGLCYNNHAVFTGVVKMRRGETAALFLGCGGMDDVYSAFGAAARSLAAACEASALPAGDPSAAITLERCAALDAACCAGLGLKAGAPLPGQHRGAVLLARLLRLALAAGLLAALRALLGVDRVAALVTTWAPSPVATAVGAAGLAVLLSRRAGGLGVARGVA